MKERGRETTVLQFVPLVSLHRLPFTSTGHNSSPKARALSSSHHVIIHYSRHKAVSTTVFSSQLFFTSAGHNSSPTTPITSLYANASFLTVNSAISACARHVSTKHVQTPPITKREVQFAPNPFQLHMVQHIN